MILCHDGRPCLLDSPDCHGPAAGLCGRPEYLEILRRKTEAGRGKGRAVVRVGGPATVAPSTPGPASAASRHAVYARFGRRVRVAVPDACVLAACDANQFAPLQMMLASLLLSHDVPVTVVDLGLTAPQRAWLDRQPVTVADPPADAPMARPVDHWQSWNKPCYFARAARRKVLWLDNDVIVDGDLTPLFDALAAAPVLVGDYFAPHPAIMDNDPALYARFPVAHPPGRICGGVVGLDLDRDAALLDAWLAMLREAARDDETRRQVAWWDQGCLIWAAASVGAERLDRPEWNTPGRPHAELYARHDDPAALLDTLPRDGATIYHFQGASKPYGWTDLFLSLRPAPGLSVTILGHEPFVRPAREWLTPVDLTVADPDQSWGECRHFDRCAIPDTEYIGLATFSWLRKYESIGRLAPWEAGELDLSPDVVWCALRTDDYTWVDHPDWTVHMERASPGITPLIEELRAISGRTEVGVSAWSNNWIVHRDVFIELVAFYRRMSAHFKAKYPVCPYKALVPAKGFGYLGEAFTVHYLASRGDLTFKEMRRPDLGPPVPTRKPAARPISRPPTPVAVIAPARPTVAETRDRLALVNACPHRGCRTGCQRTHCGRDGKDVYLSQCIACENGGAKVVAG